MFQNSRKTRGAILRCWPALLWLIAGGGWEARGQEPDGLAAAVALERAFEHAIQEAEASVVSIARIKHSPQRNAFEERANAPFVPDITEVDNPDFFPNDFGSGIILDVDAVGDKKSRKAYLLTNYHVVKGGPIEGQADPRDVTLHVRLADRRGFEAAIYAADPRSDLAVLVIHETENVKPMKFADPAKPLKKGQLVLALGNPYAIARDGSASVSWGMISNISRRPEYVGPKAADPPQTPQEETIHHLGTLLQVDTRLNLGMSGGALVNLRGELIGITTSLAALAGYEKSVGYAIPMDASTRRIIKTLREGKEVEYGFLGVQIGSSFDRRGDRRAQVRPSRQAEGVQIGILPNSPASIAGLMNNDRILAVNDIPVPTRIDLFREVGKLPPGEKARLRLARGSSSEPIFCNVDLGKWPVLDDEGIIATQRHADAWRGLIVDYPTARRKYYTDQTQYPAGVLVTEVLAQSRAASLDLVPGTYIERVDGVSVATPAEFHAKVRGLKGDVALELRSELKENRRVVLRAP